MEGSEHKESIYGFEVVDEWSGSDDEPKQSESNEEIYNFYEESKLNNRPTEGEIDAFLENVKELASCGTSGLKDDLISCKSTTVPSTNLSPGNVLSPTESITVHIDSPNGTRNVNLSINSLNCHSPSDSALKINRSTVSYKPGGTLLKTIFHDPTHSISDNSSSCIYNGELSSSSDNLLIHSLKQNEELGDGFSDNRNQDVVRSVAKKRDHVENDLKHRHRRSPEHSKYAEDKRSERKPTSTFSRERCNSRKELFNERNSREKRRKEDRRSRGKSRSRSRERRRHHRRRHGRYISLSPSPESRNVEVLEKARVTPVMSKNVIPYYPGISNPPTYVPPAQPNFPTLNPHPGSMMHSGVGGNVMNPGDMTTYPGYGLQGYGAPPQAVGYPPYQPYPPAAASNPYPQPYQNYQLPGQHQSNPSWNVPPSGPLPPHPPYSNVKDTARSDDYFNSSSSNLPQNPSQPPPWNPRSWERPEGSRRSSSRRSYSRSSSPDSRKSHKRKSKRRSRSPDSMRQRSSCNTSYSPDSDRYGASKRPKKMIIDPNRIPTPPPPPILSGLISSSKSYKSSESSLSEMLDKETVSLSCLLEAVMETSGQGKSKVSDPKVKNEILSKCETKFRQLYKKRIGGRGVFIPEPVEPIGVSGMCSPLVAFHPRLSYNEPADEQLWRCPGVKLPSPKPIELPPSSSEPLSKPEPIGTLVRPTKLPQTLDEARPAPNQQTSYPPPYNQGYTSFNPGYDPTVTPYSDPQYSANPWPPANYNTQAQWQPEIRQQPTYQQYNLVTYPNLHPTELMKTVSYPLAVKPNYPYETEESLSKNYRASPKAAPSPLKYREDSPDLLHFSEKKLKKKKKKRSHSPEKSRSIRKPIENNKSRSQNHSYEKREAPPPDTKPNYLVAKWNPNLVTLILNDSSGNQKSISNSETKRLDDDLKYWNDKNRKLNEKRSPPKKDTALNPVDNAKEKLRRKFWNSRRASDNKKDENNDRDERCIDVDLESEDHSQSLHNEDKVITIEDTDLREAYLIKPEDEAQEQSRKYSSSELRTSSKPPHYEESTSKSKTSEAYRKKDADIIEINSDSEDNWEKIKKDKDLRAINNTTKLDMNNTLSISDICGIGPDLRKIQEKSLLYNAIIESLEKGDHAYKRLYTLNNRVLCKIEKASKKLKIVVPRDNLKEFIVLLHKNFHSINQEDLFKIVINSIYPQIAYVNKCISKVFSECPNCIVQPLKLEPLVDKKIEKKSSNKTEKDLKTPAKKDHGRTPVDNKLPDENSKRRESVSQREWPSRHKSYPDKGKRHIESREQASRDGRPSGYEKAKKSRIVPSKLEKNTESKNTEECLANIPSKPEQVNESVKADLETNESCSNSETVNQNEGIATENNEPPNNKVQENYTKEKSVPVDMTESENIKKDKTESANKNDEGKPVENSVKNGSGLDFKAKIRNVQFKEYGEIINSIESGDSSKEIESIYLLKAGMLCKKIQSEGGTEVKIVAPPAEIENIIEIVHTMSSIHTPAQKVIAFFEKHFTPIDDINTKVHQFVSKCSQCK